jgi:transposase
VPAQLSHPEKDALIAALTARLALADARIAAQDARIAALEARLNELTGPPKTPGNSSKPPSRGQKPDLPAAATDRPPRKSRPGVGRTLHPHPDRVIDRLLTTCPKCEAVFPDTSQTPQQVYERIELPPIRPDVTQVRLFGGRCGCCGERATAKAPAGLEQGSPFGHSIAAMVVYLHYAHAIGMERLALLMNRVSTTRVVTPKRGMNELFSLSISEGAISNILARARQPLLDATAAIEKVVLVSPVVCSDETSVRVKGKNWWEWAEPAKGSTDAQHRWKAGGGVYRYTGGVARDQTQPRQGGGDRIVWRHPARGVGVGYAGQPARPWCAVAGVPGAPAARCDIRD